MARTAQKDADDILEPVKAEFERFLNNLGRLNYSWTNTESLLIHLIAGLSGTSKEKAVLIFLTLNTTRARVDLVERLAKLDDVEQVERDAILEITSKTLKLAGLRNRYNHCIYSFDKERGDFSTIQMRIADRKNAIKVGQMSVLNAQTNEEIEASLEALAQLNGEYWMLIARFNYPN